MVLDNFFENLFSSSEKEKEKSSPKISYKKITEPEKMGRTKGRKKDTEDIGRNLRKNPNDARSTGGIKGELNTEDNYEPMQKGNVDKPMYQKSLQELIDEKKQLTDSLNNDDRPNLEDIGDKLNVIKKEQQKRADQLRKDLNNEDTTPMDIANLLKKGGQIPPGVLTKEEREEVGTLYQNKLDAVEGETPLDTAGGGGVGDSLLPSFDKKEPDKPVEGIEQKDIITHEPEEAIHNDDAIDLSTDFTDPTMNTSLLDNTISERIIQSYFFTIIDKLVELNFGMDMNSKSIYDKYLTPIASENNVNISEFLKRLKREKTATGRLIITDKKRKSLVLRGKPLMPITIIIIYLFLCSKEELFKKNVNDLFDFQLRKFLKLFIDDKDLIQFGIGIIRNIPIELKTAFKKQLGENRTQIDSNERFQINSFVKNIYNEYERVFGDDLETGLYNFEGKKSLYLHNFLNTLGSSDTLFTISASFNNIENVFNETKTNPYLLVQLFSLFNDERNPSDDFSNEFILSNAVIDKVIVYKSNALGKTFNEEINILTNMDEETRGTDTMQIIEDRGNVALYKFNNQYFVSFKGTDINKMSDIKRNVLAYGNKNLYDDPKYNKEILDGIKLTDEAIKKSRNENLIPPKIISYSAGSISASMMALKYRDIRTDFYNPLFSKNSMTDSILKRLQKSNIKINFVDGDAISSNTPFYVKKYGLPFKKYKRKKFFNTHDLKQFL